MKLVPPPIDESLPFYKSGPLPCAYLPNRTERKLFTLLTGDTKQDSMINSLLIRYGFRRSHNIVYRPDCADCQACVPVRVSLASYKPTKSLRRVAKRNRDLVCIYTEAVPSQEHYDLFQSYQAARHADSEMASLTYTAFTELLTQGNINTHIYELRDTEGTLRGAILVDHVQDGVSAVYSYYDTSDPRRCLGTHLIQVLIEAAKKQQKLYAYLGYWIRDSRKMSYKSRFYPLQHLGPRGWTVLPRDTTAPKT